MRFRYVKKDARREYDDYGVFHDEHFVKLRSSKLKKF